MLYDNLQLARVYLHTWQVTGNEFFRTITEEILDYVVRELTDPGGGFYSTQDADSEGEEGKFFVWTPDEIREALGDEADAFMFSYGVTRHGNFEGKNILEFVGDMDQRPALAEARQKLFEAREKRVRPGRDEKVLTSWNGLMLAAFAEAARAFSPSPQPSPAGRGSREVGAETYRLIAERNAEFLLRELRQEDGRLLRTWKQGEAKLNGYLEDCAYLKVVRDGYRPFRVVALGAPGIQPPAVLLLHDRSSVDGRAAAYVCRDFACQTPVTEPDALPALLQQRRARIDTTKSPEGR